MKRSLVVQRGASKGKAFPLEDGENILGRWDPDAGAFPHVDLTAEDPEAKISRLHASLRCEQSSVTLEDLGSLNGTFVNRSCRVEQGHPVALKPGDEVILGKTFLRYEETP